MGNFVVGTRDCTASPEGVWSLLADVDRWPETWAPHLAEAHLEGPPRLGASGWVRTRIPPIRSSFRVTSVQDGRNWAWTGRMLWLTLDFDHRCEPTPDGTRVTLDVSLSGVMGGVVRLLARPVYRRQMERALDLLVELAEHRA